MKEIRSDIKKLFLFMEVKYTQSSKFIGNLMKFLTITVLMFTFRFLFASRKLELSFVFESDEPGLIIKAGIPFLFHFTFVMEFDSCSMTKRMKYEYYRIGFVFESVGFTAQCRKTTITGEEKGFYYHKSMIEILKGKFETEFNYDVPGEKFCVNMVYRGGNIPAKAGRIIMHYKPGTRVTRYSRWFKETAPCSEFVILGIESAEGSMLAETIDLYVGGKVYIGTPSESPETYIARIIAKATKDAIEFRFSDIKLMKN